MAIAVADSYSAPSGTQIYAGRPGPLPAWVSALPLWQWYAIPNTALSSVAPSPTPPGDSGPSAKINGWCGACVKRSGSKYIIGPAGGHGDYTGNEIDVLDLSAAVPQWVEIKPPSATADIILSAIAYLDERRSAGHTYYTQQFDQANNRILIAGTATPFGIIGGVSDYPPGWPWPFSSGAFMAFDMAANEWLHPDALAVIPTGGSEVAQLTCVDPLNDDVYTVKSGITTGLGRLWRYRPSTNAWTDLGAWGISGGYAGSAVDHARNRLFAVGDSNGVRAPMVRSIVDGSALSPTFGGLGPDVLKLGGYPGVEYDEANDCFLVCVNSNPIEVLRVDASTFYVDSPTVTGTKPAQRTNGIQNSFRYVPELKGVVIANSYSGNVQFMRTHL